MTTQVTPSAPDRKYAEFQRVRLSLADLCGEEYVHALCANRAFLTGENHSKLLESATKKIDFFPAEFERRLVQLLPAVGTRVGPVLAQVPAGATTRQFARHSKLKNAPVGALGYYRVGEDGMLSLITKSEHYHAPLGHSFPGYALIDIARQLGIPNATHNNTRGFLTRLLEAELVASANGLAPDDHAGLQAVLQSSAPGVMNRVLNLETGSLAAEAALKLMLARFYYSEDGQAAPKYSGRVPVVLVVGNDEGGLRANYHGTTILTQVMRGMWPELYELLRERGFQVAAIRPNSMADLEAAVARYEQGKLKIAGFFHEIVLMNYGGRLLSREFLTRAYELCRAHDVPVMCDEIQSCLWAPEFFMFREYGLKPSLVAIGKGFPGGEYAASRILFSADLDALAQFGALITNGQQELAALAYLVTMRWATANREVTREIGDCYEHRLRDLAREYPALISGVEGNRHLTCLNFPETSIANSFASAAQQRGLDVSTQTYKPDCPPAVLTKLPLIAGFEVVAYVHERLRDILKTM